METNALITTLASDAQLTPVQYVATVKKTCCPPIISEENFFAFLLIAHRYKLDPILKQIYAFPSKTGQIIPVVSIDGWLAIINSHPDFDGMEFEDVNENGKLVSITCRMYRKSRSHATEVTEYMVECVRATDTWKQWPARMLRHKATIQAARYAFGISGIYDQDEAERINAGELISDQETGEITKPATRVEAAQEVMRGRKKTDAPPPIEGEARRQEDDPAVPVAEAQTDSAPALPGPDDIRVQFQTFTDVTALSQYMNGLPQELRAAMNKDFAARVKELKGQQQPTRRVA